MYEIYINIISANLYLESPRYETDEKNVENNKKPPPPVYAFTAFDAFANPR